MLRLPPDALYPTGERGVAARFLRLRSGVRVRVVEAGEAGGEPVMLLGGWACTAYVWRHTLRALAGAGFRATAVELKGQGLSDKPLAAGEYTLDSLVVHVGDVLDALGLDRLALVGHSLGAAIATRMALAEAGDGAPPRVSRLALLSPVGFGSIGIAALARRLPAFIGPLLPYASARWWWRVGVRTAYGPSTRPGARDIDEYWAPTADPGYVRSLVSAVREVDWSLMQPQMLRDLAIPVLVVFGTADRVVSPRALDRVLQAVPQARKLLLPGVGHAVQEVAPEPVNRALVEFLRA